MWFLVAHCQRHLGNRLAVEQAKSRFSDPTLVAVSQWTMPDHLLESSCEGEEAEATQFGRVVQAEPKRKILVYKRLRSRKRSRMVGLGVGRFQLINGGSSERPREHIERALLFQLANRTASQGGVGTVMAAQSSA